MYSHELVESAAVTGAMLETHARCHIHLDPAVTGGRQDYMVVQWQLNRRFRFAMLRNGDEEHFPQDTVEKLQSEVGACLQRVRSKKAGSWPDVFTRLYAGTDLYDTYLSPAAHRAKLDAAGAGPGALERKKAFWRLSGC